MALKVKLFFIGDWKTFEPTYSILKDSALQFLFYLENCLKSQGFTLKNNDNLMSLECPFSSLGFSPTVLLKC